MKKSKQKTRAIAGTVLTDGTLVETLYDPDEGKTFFLVGDAQTQAVKSSVSFNKQEKLVPLSAGNALIRYGVMLLPSGAEEYEHEESLLESIEAYINSYCDLPADFIKTAAAYALFTWVYDRFAEVPYLRLTGSFGTGKTRFLLTIGSITYRPIFASGASTVAPIFHSLNDYRGTLIMDEADFRFSDEKADIIKILNNGNLKGFPILRCAKRANGEFDPKAYNVFGPKIVATRGRYDDPALESRFITQTVWPKTVREDIPINMPSRQQTEALKLRNQLLMFRFRNFHRTDIRPDLDDLGTEGRVSQIFRPLLSVIPNDEYGKAVAKQAMKSHQAVRAAREDQVEVLAVKALMKLSDKARAPSLKALSDVIEQQSGRAMSPRQLGHVIRNKLGLSTIKRGGVFVVSDLSPQKLVTLMDTFGLRPDSVTKRAEQDGGK